MAARTAFLVSKSLGLKLLQSIDLEQALILHPDDRADCRSGWPEFQKLGARMVGGPLEARSELESFRPDIVLVCGWYWLIPPDVRAIAPLGFFGIHNSLLPAYRGGAPLVWAIMEGEEKVGSTLFRLADGIDDGPIVYQVSIELPRTANVGDATVAIEAAWKDVFPGIWARLCAKAISLVAQDGQPTTFPNRKPHHGAIDWTLPAARVHDFIRAQSRPYPGAFCDGGIVEASAETDITLAEPVGRIVAGTTDYLVRCGDDRSLAIRFAADGAQPGGRQVR